MKIETNKNNISTKAIHLNKQETIEAQKILTKYRVSNSLTRQNLTQDLLSIFEEKIRIEGKHIAKTTHIQQDCIQDLFLKFFESITKSVTVKEPLNFILKQLNEFKKKKDALKTEFGRASLDREVRTDRNKPLFFTDIVQKDISSITETNGQEQAKNEIEKLIKTENLTEKEKSVFYKLMQGKTHKEISEEMGIALGNVNKHIARAIRKIQYKTNCLPEDMRNKIASLKKIFGIKNSDKYIEKLIIQLPQNLTINKISEQVSEYKNLLKTNAENVIHIFANTPTLLSLNISTVKNNIEQSSKLLGLSNKEFIQCCQKHPSLLYMSPESLKKNANNVQKTLEISEEDCLKIIKITPSILYQKASTLNKKFEELARLLNISKKDCLKIYQKSPCLFSNNIKTLENNMRKTAKLLNINFDKYISLAQKQANLMYQKPKTIYNNVVQGSKLLNVDKETLKNEYIKRPQLFVQKPETIYNNVVQLSKLLHLELSQCIKLCLTQPQLFYMKPENIYNKANELAKLKHTDLKSIVEWTIKQPNILLYKTSLIEQKMEINNFFSKIINEPLKGTTLSMNKDEELYSKTLKFLIKKANKTSISSSKKIYDAIKQNLTENPNIEYVFEIPQHSQTANFIKFTKDFSEEILGKNIFSFKILEN